MVLDDQLAVTPAGRPVVVPMPVAPVVVCVIAGLIGVLTHKVGLEDAAVTVLFGLTVMVPVAFTVPHPPVNGIVYENVPVAVGVPLIVMVLEDHEAFTPAGKPVAVPIPVAPVVVWVITGLMAVLTHNVGLDDAAVTVLTEITVMVPVAFTVPHPPVNGMV